MRANDPVNIPEKDKKDVNEEENSSDDISESETPESAIEEPLLTTPIDWDGYDAFCLFILVFLGIFSRFWIIQYPRHFTDDEAMHVQYLNCYQNGSFFLMSQPPFAEMFLSVIVESSNYKQNYRPPYHEDNFTFPTMEYVALRAPSAFASAIVIPLSFFIVRIFGSSTFGAMGAGLFTLFDFLLIGNARNIGTDGIIQLFVALTMLFTAILKRLKKNSKLWKLCIICQALFCGFCVSSDWSCVSLVFFVILFNFITYKDINTMPKTLFVISTVFFSTFIVHSLLIPYKSGNERVLSDAYISDLYEYGQNVQIKHKHVFKHAVELMKKTLRLHKVRSSRVQFYKWVTMTCNWKVLWTQKERVVAVFGNIPVWWGIFVVSLCQFLKSFLTKRLKDTTTIIFCGFIEILAYYMFSVCERGLRDYQIALLFGIWGLALSLDTELPDTVSGFILALFTVSAGFIFIIWAPLVYGYENFDVRFLPYFAK